MYRIYSAVHWKMTDLSCRVCGPQSSFPFQDPFDVSPCYAFATARQPGPKSKPSPPDTDPSPTLHLSSAVGEVARTSCPSLPVAGWEPWPQ